MERSMQRNFYILPLLLLLVLGDSYAQEYRAFDGFNNNPINPEWGASHSLLQYWSRLDYADGYNEPKLDDTFGRPNPREISNAMFAQEEYIPDFMGLSDYTWVFGQFLDHDITLIENSHTELLTNVVIPEDDEWFTPGQFMPILRNIAAPGTGTDINNPRKHMNLITSFVDGSNVYGSDFERASWLRAEDGKLKVSSGNLLPWNTIDGEFNSPIDPESPFMGDDTRQLTKWFVAGDVRANENPLLIAFHTLFVREHNRLAEKLKEKNPDWDSDKIYYEARKYNSAAIQSIVYNEWLPAMGIKLPEYQGFNSNINPAISNAFSAAAFRLGHTLINSNIIRMNNEGDELSMGNISLRDAFFNPYVVIIAGGVDPYFKGMGTQVQQKLDCKVINDVRNFLFGPPGAGGLDLASINITRGRERGLPGFNDLREDFGLPRYHNFSELTDIAEEAALLEEIYGTVERVDPWVGMLAEKKIPNTLFGETMMVILMKQFQHLRDGDRFFYENNPALTEEEKEEIRNIKLHDILMRNTDISIMQRDLFVAMSHDDIPNGPEIPQNDLAAAAFPNPVSDLVNIKLFAEQEKFADLAIVDYAGKVIYRQSIHLYEGDNILPIHMNNNLFPRGLYNFVINYGDNYNVVKVIKE